MKKLILFCMSVCMSTLLFAQATAPTIMFFPAEQWMIKNGYSTTKTKENGKEYTTFDYVKAVRMNNEMATALTTLGGMMKERGFDPKDILSQSEGVEADNTFNAASDVAIEQSDQDVLLAHAKPDLVIEANYYTDRMGPQITLHFTLTAKDSYTRKQVATTGNIDYGPVMASTSMNTLIQSALKNSFNAFCAQLMAHFQDMQQNGREVRIDVLTNNGLSEGFETELSNGDELGDFVDSWVKKNAVAGRAHKSVSSTKSITYDAVRIPLYGPDGSAMSAEDFIKLLRKAVKAELKTSSIDAHITTQMQGLGKAQIIIGD